MAFQHFERTLAVGLMIVATAGGFLMAVRTARLRWRMAVYFALFLASVLIDCLPWFERTPSTWLITYVSGIWMAGIASLIVHVLPAILTYHGARCWIKCRLRREIKSKPSQ